jgi:hypothetical protein
MLCRNVSLIFSMTIGTIKKNSLPSPTGGVLLTGQKNQKPLAAIIIPPIRWTDDPARAERLAAGILSSNKSKKAKQASASAEGYNLKTRARLRIRILSRWSSLSSFTIKTKMPPSRARSKPEMAYPMPPGRADRYHDRVMAEAGSDSPLPDGDPSRVLGLDSGCALTTHPPFTNPGWDWWNRGGWGSSGNDRGYSRWYPPTVNQE